MQGGLHHAAAGWTHDQATKGAGGNGHFLTVPLQLAYIYFADVKWADVIPFRMKSTLKVWGETTCNISITEGATQFQQPRLEVSGQNVSVAEYQCKASPWVFRQACYVYLCRIISAQIWLLTLMGYLLAVSIAGGVSLGIITTSAVCLGSILTGIYLAVRACNLCRKKMEQLE